MYSFIKKTKDDEKVTIDDVLDIESRFGFKMPEILKDFYLMYNGSSIYPCIFSIDGYEVEVAKLVELKYGFLPLEKNIETDRTDGFIPFDMIPVARNSGGDYYYWNNQSGQVYLYLSDSIEDPIWICENAVEFFSLLERNCQADQEFM
jgi:hypothetical protein